MSPLSLTAKIFLYGMAVLVCLLGILFFWFAHGEPVHDINIWRLERNFYAKEISHPNDSVLLEKMKYLGGSSTHGDSRCMYAVGEMRTAPFSKEDIKEFYQDIVVAFWKEYLPLKVLFADEYDGPYVMPYVNWQDELYGMPPSDDTRYIVYVGTEWPILFMDLRCDD